jgi:hypothetical protein
MGIPSFFFDNGTHGTINVKYPDVIDGINGGTDFLKYSDLDTTSGYAAVLYSGNFPQSNQPGKIALIGFPFETIYPQEIRYQLMNRLLNFFDYTVSANQNYSDIPNHYSLTQNYPNPFNPTTKLSYSIAQSGLVTLKVYDVLGTEIETLINEEKTAGSFELSWDASYLPSGVYFYRLQAGDFTETKKMILLK